MEGPPQRREGPASLRARAHRAGQAVCQRAPPRTSHCHTACTPPCPIMRLIRLRPGRPFPWPTALHNRTLCKLGAGPRAHGSVVPTSARSCSDGGSGYALATPRREIGPPAGQSCLRRCAARQAGPLPALLTGTTRPSPQRASKLTSSALRAGHRRTASRARFASAAGNRSGLASLQRTRTASRPSR